MDIKTYLKIIVTCEGRKTLEAQERAFGINSIAISSDSYALRWQKLDRISRCAQSRLLAINEKQERAIARLINLSSRKRNVASRSAWAEAWDALKSSVAKQSPRR